ncbi:hypothetical protein S7711_11615 [Stachybotrys chartarum IBT 7711]|uniref:Uncharacterized protein n=1 Tax=Stachybotrys chartarum (strain CBS 109288 / IBT 7711) TaxID=1280523 RepID=A0A084B7W1_STACB|nr:hypothetical protein S7711_11615 [Stachybotrys chartarum IBT 7711]
MQTCRVVFS